MGTDGNARSSQYEAHLSLSEHGVDDGCSRDGEDPDLLKNTPSNIRRLADEIEQCEGRQKYLAQTRSPSDGGDVRWYFCKVPLRVNELAASIPHGEIVGKGEYFRFGMRDSLAIEASFLQREEELLSYWWKEYAECSEGPKGRTSSTTEADLFQSELYTVEEERVGVPVKGGLYEVDLVKRHSFPVYWNGENRRVLRGHWFAQSGGLDWLPLREDVAEQLEFAYRRQVTDRILGGIWQRVINWIGSRRRGMSLLHELRWMSKNNRGKGQIKACRRVALSATIYEIWGERNSRIFSGHCRSVAQIVHSIQFFDSVQIITKQTYR